MVKKFNTASNVIFLIIFVVSSLSFTTIFDYYNLQAERKEEIYKSNIEYKQEIIELETKQHELIYFNNIPVQKVSGSVFGKFNFGSGNVSGQISTTDEISYWYLVGDKQALHYSVPTSKSVLTFYEEGTQKPCVNFHKKAKKIITINHNDGSQKSKTEPETWYEYVFYLPQSVMLSN